MNNDALDSLERRSDFLKSELLHQQLKYGKISLRYYKKYSSIVLNEYKKYGSLFKSSSLVGIDQNIVMEWYIQGQLKNPHFRSFYLTIKRINRNMFNSDDLSSSDNDNDAEIELGDFEGDYVISRYGDGWSYKTYAGGEKIFIISNELETLKQKVNDKRLPID